MWDGSNVGLGGGFLDESTSGTQAGGGKKGAQSNDRSIVPVLIKHIISATGDLQIAGKTVNTLTFVGIVRHIEQETTKISYHIQDDTGTLTAMMWLEADKNAREDILVNTYVRVHGLIRDQHNQRNVLILRIYPLEDLNELTCHFVEVIYFMLMFNKPTEESSAAPNMVVYDNTMSGMTPEQMMVLEVVRSADDGECGIEKRIILTKIPKHVVSRLDEILDFLLCEGHIYTTSSEDFFKAT
ncbi:replication protein A 32 kDa subunit-A [Odontomachus brunneus]|uniref:replication protein A 32 kDa subunit-A n=1 Tax=Odontomachus brunneus TaxID=486640 RepID=UPI0013F198BD|nr:replication protein A 32 kDa subunit-A [Odontomachus brunneus]XP_032687953.1 replication protein A 32 kDa subunit-A [Odontomachus brunneus]XP_032687954.1 replication protein A 32 kDa subunit-A [Odontomachus brunneus]XP_032687955.1 replication protein A 32 kDa subunit-A [Odontomachus brunneus]XP_032687956.1 replication protein A 32 kDa subunit-A [Odontomachus brunneus]